MNARIKVLIAFGAMGYSQIGYPNEAHQIVSRMSDSQRNSTFEKFMARSGEDCPTVQRNFFQGTDKRGNATWNVACSNKKSFAITIYNDSQGSTKILNCAALKAVANVDCFKKF